jgi:hypothetical protein
MTFWLGFQDQGRCLARKRQDECWQECLKFKHSIHKSWYLGSPRKRNYVIPSYVCTHSRKSGKIEKQGWKLRNVLSPVDFGGCTADGLTTWTAGRGLGKGSTEKARPALGLYITLFLFLLPPKKFWPSLLCWDGFVKGIGEAVSMRKYRQTGQTVEMHVTAMSYCENDPAGPWRGASPERSSTPFPQLLHSRK